jgi:predicted dehydrogenase
VSSSSRSPDADVLVAGAGAMAAEHVRALVATGVAPQQVVVAARRPERVESLAREHGVRAASLDEAAAPFAIVAVAEDALVPVAESLLARGAERVLVEKPGALTSSELARLRDVRGDVFVAYNRRFYPSAARARELIDADGGPVALALDFTEVEARVLADAERRSLDASVLARWGVANSLHVLDLAFHLGGDPERLECERAGSLPWHPSGARFAGSGTTTRGALFAYLATWDGAGRWGVELTTRERRLALRPLEELQEQRRGSFALEPVDLPREPAGVKPGLAGQLRAFLDGDARFLCGVDEAVARIELAERICGYG